MLKDWIMFSDRNPNINEPILVCARGGLFGIIRWPKHIEDMRFFEIIGKEGNYNSDILELDAWIPLSVLEKYIPNENANLYCDDDSIYITIPRSMISDIYHLLSDFIENDIRRCKMSEKDKQQCIIEAYEISKKLMLSNPHDK